MLDVGKSHDLAKILPRKTRTSRLIHGAGTPSSESALRVVGIHESTRSDESETVASRFSRRALCQRAECSGSCVACRKAGAAEPLLQGGWMLRPFRGVANRFNPSSAPSTNRRTSRVTPCVIPAQTRGALRPPHDHSTEIQPASSTTPQVAYDRRRHAMHRRNVKLSGRRERPDTLTADNRSCRSRPRDRSHCTVLLPRLGTPRHRSKSASVALATGRKRIGN